MELGPMQPRCLLAFAAYLRGTWHPLHRLRKFPIFCWITQFFDVQIWVSIYGIPWKVRILSLRNASYWLNKQTIEPELVALFLALHKVFSVQSFWDIGAHIGMYGLLLKGQDQQIEILMFEPDPVNVRLLKRTIQQAAIETIRVLPYAVSDREGEALFALDTISGATGTLEHPDLSFVARHYHTSPQTIRVQKTSIDEVRKSEKRVDLIKIDVEHHEREVFKGAARTLERDQPILIFESFNHGPEISRYLREMGYVVFDADSMRQDLEGTFNFLALPTRCVTKIPELLSTVKQEYRTLGI